jgi:hypothetical protein
VSLAVSSLISSRFKKILFSELLDRYWNLLCSHRDQYASLVCQKPLMNGFVLLPVGAVFGGQMTHNMMPSPMLSVEASGMFAAGPSFPAEASYPGTQLYTQTIMRPAGYNPFA